MSSRSATTPRLRDDLSFKPSRARQPLVGLLVIALFAGAAPFLADEPARFTLHILTGIAFGYILTRSRFGFAGGIKRVWVLGDGSLTTALAVSFGLIALFTAGLQWSAAAKGAVPDFLAGEADSIIPGTQNVQSVGIALMIGGILFGAGMIMAGGCASGTLADVGEGQGRALLALPFFILGAVPGHYLRAVIQRGPLGDVGLPEVYLPSHVGYLGAVVLTIAGLAAVYAFVRRYEQRRKRERAFAMEEWEKNDLPAPALTADEKFRFFSWRSWHDLLATRWTFMLGGILIAFAAAFTLASTGKAWGVTSAFTEWGVKFFNLFGIQFTDPAFDSINEGISEGLLNGGTTVRDIGIIVGAAVALLLAAKFTFNFSMTGRDAVIYMLGGLFMGIGARMAGGCNVGALYSAIGTFSLSGWFFGLALWIGGFSALKLLAGKMSIIPPDRHAVPKSRQKIDA